MGLLQQILSSNSFALVIKHAEQINANHNDCSVSGSATVNRSVQTSDQSPGGTCQKKRKRNSILHSKTGNIKPLCFLTHNDFSR